MYRFGQCRMMVIMMYVPLWSMQKDGDNDVLLWSVQNDDDNGVCTALVSAE